MGWVNLLFVYVTYSNASWAEYNLVQRDLFDAHFQHLALDRPDDERTATFVEAPADLVLDVYGGGLKTWECALGPRSVLDRAVLRSQSAAEAGTGETVAAGRRIRGSHVLDVSCVIRLLGSVVAADG